MSEDPIAILQRWDFSGGTWRVLGRRGDTVTIGLFRCDGGELVDTVQFDDPAAVAFVDGRKTSSDDPSSQATHNYP